MADRMLELVLRASKYETLLPMADQGEQIRGLTGDHRGGDRVLKELVERDLSELDVLVVYLDGRSCSGTTTCWRRWAWMPTAASTCWGFAAGHRRTRTPVDRRPGGAGPAGGSQPCVVFASTAPRRCGRPSGGCSGRRTWCNVVETTRSGTACARAGASLRAAWKLDADEGIRKLELGWSGSGRRRRGACAKGCRSCSGQSPWAAEAAAPLPDDDEPRRTLIVRQHTNRVSRWQSEEMLRGADGPDAGSAHGSSRLALADDAHSYAPYMLWSPSCPG